MCLSVVLRMTNYHNISYVTCGYVVPGQRRVKSVVSGQSVVGWTPDVTDWLSQRSRRVGTRGTLSSM